MKHLPMILQVLGLTGLITGVLTMHAWGVGQVISHPSAQPTTITGSLG